MPTYEYRCNTCKQTFEKFENITDTPSTRCPSCDGSVNRLIGTGGGFILKGSGFHQNDYPASTQRPSENTRCDRDTPCCGRDRFCGSPHCER